MENLAGRYDCDYHIFKELNLAGIPAFLRPKRSTGEVESKVIGRLSYITLQREWYYYVAEGQVPLDIARKMYLNPLGKKDVRADSDCGRLPLDKFAQYYDLEGIRLLGLRKLKHLEKTERLFGSNEAVMQACRDVRLESRFVPNPKKEASSSFVDSYHIDSQAGLCLFAAMLKGHLPVTAQKSADEDEVEIKDEFKVPVGNWIPFSNQQRRSQGAADTYTLERMWLPDEVDDLDHVTRQFIVDIKNGSEVVSIARDQIQDENWNLEGYYFTDSQPTGFQFKGMLGKGFPENRPAFMTPEILMRLFDLTNSRPAIADSLLECCKHLLDPGPEYSESNQDRIIFKFPKRDKPDSSHI